MFGRIKKEKIELSSSELRILMYALNDFRNDLLNEVGYSDAIDVVMVKLKPKMKVDRYDLGAMINGLDRKRKRMIVENQDTQEIDELLLKLVEANKKCNKKW